MVAWVKPNGLNLPPPSGLHHFGVTCPNHYFLRLPRNLHRHGLNPSHMWEIRLSAKGLRTSLPILLTLDLAILLTLERHRHPQDHQC